MAIVAEENFKSFHANFVCKAGITVNCTQFYFSLFVLLTQTYQGTPDNLLCNFVSKHFKIYPIKLLLLNLNRMSTQLKC